MTSVSVCSLHIIPTATDIHFPGPKQFDTTAPGISESQIHLLTTYHIADTLCTQNLVPGCPGIEHLWPETAS